MQLVMPDPGEVLDNLTRNLEAYPAWLVASCAIIAAVGLVWLLVKVLKWTLYLAAMAVAGFAVTAVVLWWLGQ
jgi:uncharacterized membrane protein